MKIAVFCAYGNVRSNGVGNVLKDCCGQTDVVVAGLVTTSETTRAMLCTWADLILIAGESELQRHLPEQFHSKVRVLDIGPDVWGIGRHPDLIRRIIHELRRQSVVDMNRCHETEFIARVMGNMRALVKWYEANG